MEECYTWYIIAQSITYVRMILNSFMTEAVMITASVMKELTEVEI